MKQIAVIGAGAFGTALAVALGQDGRQVTLWARDAEHVARMRADRRNDARLAGVDLPETVSVTADLDDIAGASTVLLVLPMQALGSFLKTEGARFAGLHVVACCKGVDIATFQGPTALIAGFCPDATPAILTGPSFANDIAKGLPTALTLACADEVAGETLQNSLSTSTLRLYRTSDVVGAELGGALKNVIAIAAGIVIGAGLGDSARAALMTRGYAEMQRLALALGARPETLGGLSGLGDLVLTCTSAQSRNFRFGQSLGTGTAFDKSITVEGATTALAVSGLAGTRGLDMPITDMVSAVITGRLTIPEAVQALLSRPLKQE